VETITSISVADFSALLDTDPNLSVLDVRKTGEYETGHLDVALTNPLDYINDWTNELTPSKTYYIHCAGGYRSMVAASILKARGVTDVIDIAGGYAAIKLTNLKRTDHTVASKELIR